MDDDGGDDNKYRCGTELHENGYTTFKLLNDESTIVRAREQLFNDMKMYVEYKNPGSVDEYVYNQRERGGVLSNPSSFHSPSVRHLREVAENACARVLSFLLNARCHDPSKKIYSEQLFDQLRVGRHQRRRRQCHASQSSRLQHHHHHYHHSDEKWIINEMPLWLRLPKRFNCVGEREERATKLNLGRILCGWINLDVDKNHYFTCCKGEHYSRHPTVDTRRVTRVCVPPGHMILYFQRIPHLQEETHTCMHVAWNINATGKPLFGDAYMKYIFAQRDAPVLPDGTLPQMYRAHDISSIQKKKQLNTWSMNSFKHCLRVYHNSSLIPMHMIHNPQLCNFSAYSTHEKRIMSPKEIQYIPY